jgi:hypothetical protein
MMKRSNIIIISTAVLAISWLLISGWLQANAYNDINAGNTCSYAVITGQENAMKITAFKNINIDAAKILITPEVYLTSGDKYEISFSNSMKNAVSTRISGDTLYLKIIRKTFGMSGQINIHLPLLNSVNIKTDHDTSGMFERSGVSAKIMGFKCSLLSINNTGQNDLSIYNTQFKKLVIRGNFYKGKEINIENSKECDSLDIDIKGQYGRLVIGNNNRDSWENSIKWSRISIPETFRVTAIASITRKIILKE